jgi:hypothetical protein
VGEQLVVSNWQSGSAPPPERTSISPRSDGRNVGRIVRAPNVTGSMVFARRRLIEAL